MACVSVVGYVARARRFARSGLVRRTGHLARRTSTIINESRASGDPGETRVWFDTGHQAF